MILLVSRNKEGPSHYILFGKIPTPTTFRHPLQREIWKWFRSRPEVPSPQGRGVGREEERERDEVTDPVENCVKESNERE